MNEIKIIMKNPNEPPILLHNDKVISGIVSLNYQYETSTDDSPGRHAIELRYIDIDNRTIRTAALHRNADDSVYPVRLEGSE